MTNILEKKAANIPSLLSPNANDKILNFAEELTEKAHTDWRSIWRDAAEFGVLRRSMPHEFGGDECSAQDFVSEMIALGQNFADNGLTMGLNSHVWTIQQPLVRFGSNGQKAQYLPKFMTGEKIGAYALTETISGSDALALDTSAKKSDGGYVLDGSKTFIGMGPVCDIALVFASTAPDRGSWGISTFLVEAKDKGFIREPPQSKIGLSTLPMGTLRFENCWIPENRRLGPEGAGAQIFHATLDWERSFILASHVGAMKRQFDASNEYTRSREVFGQPIADFQSVSNRLADMRVRLETCRLMLDKAAALYDAGEPLSLHAAMTNLHISESFLTSSIEALRNFGGAGYLSSAMAGQDVNDALGGVIYSGTSDVLRGIVARLAGLQVRRPS